MLYRPEAFEPLTEASWDDDRARDRIRAIVADTDQALRGPRLLWRAHEWDSWHGTSPMKNLYVGAAGVLARRAATARTCRDSARPRRPRGA